MPCPFGFSGTAEVEGGRHGPGHDGHPDAASAGCEFAGMFETQGDGPQQTQPVSRRLTRSCHTISAEASHPQADRFSYEKDPGDAASILHGL